MTVEKIKSGTALREKCIDLLNENRIRFHKNDRLGSKHERHQGHFIYRAVLQVGMAFSPEFMKLFKSMFPDSPTDRIYLYLYGDQWLQLIKACESRGMNGNSKEHPILEPKSDKSTEYLTHPDMPFAEIVQTVTKKALTERIDKFTFWFVREFHTRIGPESDAMIVHSRNIMQHHQCKDIGQLWRLLKNNTQQLPTPGTLPVSEQEVIRIRLRNKTRMIKASVGL